MIGLTFTLPDLGKWDEAEQLVTEAAGRKIQVLGAENNDTILPLRHWTRWREERTAMEYWRQRRLEQEAREIEVRRRFMRKMVMTAQKDTKSKEIRR